MKWSATYKKRAKKQVSIHRSRTSKATQRNATHSQNENNTIHRLLMGITVDSDLWYAYTRSI